MSILGRHRIDGVGDQVQEHLLQLSSISYHLRQLNIGFDLYQYLLLLQIAAHQGNGIPNEIVDVKQGSDPSVLLEVRPNAFDHCSRAMTISGDLLELRLRL